MNLEQFRRTTTQLGWTWHGPLEGGMPALGGNQPHTALVTHRITKPLSALPGGKQVLQRHKAFLESRTEPILGGMEDQIGLPDEVCQLLFKGQNQVQHHLSDLSGQYQLQHRINLVSQGRIIFENRKPYVEISFGLF